MTESQTYAGLTLGPIYEVMRHSKKTREQWFGSYFFSWFMEIVMKDLAEILGPDIFLTPHLMNHESKSYAGKYPDRFVLKTRQPVKYVYHAIESTCCDTCKFFSNKYLITFTPVEAFFFGGDVSFADNYYVQSDKFPSQPTIIGALRASLLTRKGYMLQHKNGRYIPKEYREHADLLTGKTRLNSLTEDSNVDFGIIQKISPCFLVDKYLTNAYFPIPNDIIKLKNDTQFHQRIFQSKKGLANNCSMTYESIPIQYLKASNTLLKQKDIDAHGAFYGGKQFFQQYLKNHPIESTNIIHIDNYYISHRQAGIGLEKRKVKDGAFYVKTHYTLKENHAFAIIGHFKDEPF